MSPVSSILPVWGLLFFLAVHPLSFFFSLTHSLLCPPSQSTNKVYFPSLSLPLFSLITLQSVLIQSSLTSSLSVSFSRLSLHHSSHIRQIEKKGRWVSAANFLPPWRKVSAAQWHFTILYLITEFDDEQRNRQIVAGNSAMIMSFCLHRNALTEGVLHVERPLSLTDAFIHYADGTLHCWNMW